MCTSRLSPLALQVHSPPSFSPLLPHFSSCLSVTASFLLFIIFAKEARLSEAFIVCLFIYLWTLFLGNSIVIVSFWEWVHMYICQRKFPQTFDSDPAKSHLLSNLLGCMNISNLESWNLRDHIQYYIVFCPWLLSLLVMIFKVDRDRTQGNYTSVGS